MLRGHLHNDLPATLVCSIDSIYLDTLKIAQPSAPQGGPAKIHFVDSTHAC